MNIHEQLTKILDAFAASNNSNLLIITQPGIGTIYELTKVRNYYSINFAEEGGDFPNALIEIALSSTQKRLLFDQVDKISLKHLKPFIEFLDKFEKKVLVAKNLDKVPVQISSRCLIYNINLHE